MSHWTIGDGELRRHVHAQSDRYRELRRLSDEARLVEAVRAPGLTPFRRLRRWLVSVLGRPHRSETQRVSSIER